MIAFKTLIIYNDKSFLFDIVSRGKLTKDEIKHWVLRFKKELADEPAYYATDPKNIANKYLNKVLEKIEEYSN